MSVKELTSGLVGPRPVREPAPLSYIRSVLHAGVRHQQATTGMQCTTQPLRTRWEFSFKTSTQWDTHTEDVLDDGPEVHTETFSERDTLEVVPPDICEKIGNRIAEETVTAVLKYMWNVPIDRVATTSEYETLEHFVMYTQRYPYDKHERVNARGELETVPALDLLHPFPGFGKTGWSTMREWVASDAERRQGQYKVDMGDNSVRLLTNEELHELTRVAPCTPQLLVNTVFYMKTVFLRFRDFTGDEDKAIKKFVSYLADAIDNMQPVDFRQGNGTSVQMWSVPFDKKPSFEFETLRSAYRRYSTEQPSFYSQVVE